MDFNLFARVAKLAALFGFFLPWVTVSCAGSEVLQATGWQLMTGDPQPSGGGEVRQEDGEPALLVIAAFAVIAAALAASLLVRRRAAAAVLLAGALAGAGLSWFSIENMGSEMNRSLSEQQGEENAMFSAEQQREMAQEIQNAIEIERQEGFWLTLGALALAALFALLTLGVREAAPARSENTG